MKQIPRESQPTVPIRPRVSSNFYAMLQYSMTNKVSLTRRCRSYAESSTSMMTSWAIAVHGFEGLVVSVEVASPFLSSLFQIWWGRLNYSAHAGTQFILLPVSSVHSSPQPLSCDVCPNLERLFLFSSWSAFLLLQHLCEIHLQCWRLLSVGRDSVAGFML